MKILEWPSTKKLTEDSVLLTDGDSGTKKILASDAILSMLSILSPKSHRMTYRGKHLGTSLTSTQRANIQNGSFNDLWLGDYWVINDIKWLIVDFDYWYNDMTENGEQVYKHHLVIMPEKSLYTARMNSTNTTEGGYVNSEMYTTNLTQAKTIVDSAFGSAVLTHGDQMSNAFSNGVPNGQVYLDVTVNLPNETMMYGHPQYRVANMALHFPRIYENKMSQLALFRVCPEFITDRDNALGQWLMDPITAYAFAFVGPDGIAAGHDKNASAGCTVRPAFAIG